MNMCAFKCCMDIFFYKIPKSLKMVKIDRHISPKLIKFPQIVIFFTLGFSQKSKTVQIGRKWKFRHLSRWQWVKYPEKVIYFLSKVEKGPQKSKTVQIGRKWKFRHLSRRQQVKFPKIVEFFFSKVEKGPQKSKTVQIGRKYFFLSCIKNVISLLTSC